MNEKILALPSPVNGVWIWGPSRRDRETSYVFFRKRFDIDFGTIEADLWITAHSEYHIFINGRHVGYGPPAAMDNAAYVEKYDVSYFLEPGPNVLGVLARHDGTPRVDRGRNPAGMWCQLNIDGDARFWADADWEVLIGGPYETRAPRRGYALGHTENVNMVDFPEDWSRSEGVNNGGWTHAEVVSPLYPERLMVSPLAPLALEPLDEISLRAAGTFAATALTTHVSFASLPERDTAETYAAETYVFLDAVKEIRYVISSDDPIRFYVNGALIDADDMGESAAEGQLLERCHWGPNFRAIRGGFSGKLRLNAGWNRFLAVQRRRSDGMGVFMIFPGLSGDDLKFFQKQDDHAERGWTIAGPLRMPLNMTAVSLRMDRLESRAFVPTIRDLNDAAGYLGACRFSPDQRLEDREKVLAPPNPVMVSSDYLIFDLGRPRYGVAEIELSAAAGDIIDIIHGNHLVGNRVSPESESGRAVTTVRARDGENLWRSFAPRSARYLMICGRDISSAGLTINRVGFTAFHREFESAASFECSDPVLSDIWDAGLATLENTLQNSFLSDTAGRQAQFLHGAMAQSLSAMNVMGDTAMTLKAAREFAAAQYENGDLPALCPSGLPMDCPDLALLFPVWLQYAYMWTGNRAFLLEMAPTLNALLDYFKTWAESQGGLLSDDPTRRGAGLFIDGGDIDTRGTITALNALYCRALLSSAFIYDAIERPEKAAAFRRTAVEVAEALNDLTFDEKRGLYADCHHVDGLSDKHSARTNILALLSGVADSSAFERIFGEFFDMKTFEDKHADADLNSYFKFFALETACAFGRADWAIGHIRHYWGKMIEAGAKTCWSTFNPKIKMEPMNGADLCYGAGALPNFFLLREVAGIQPLDPGFTRVAFCPQLTASKSVKAVAPTPHGRIRVMWEIDDNDNLTVQIESSYPIDVVPRLPEAYLGRCEMSVNSHVRVFEPLEEGTLQPAGATAEAESETVNSRA